MKTQTMNLALTDLILILLITMGPLKPAIVFVTLTAKSDAAFRRKVALRTVLTAGVVAILFVFGGEFILNAFHVSLPALKLAGGLILLIYALEMVIGKESKDSGGEAAEQSTNISVYPLAMPLTATPQALVLLATFAASDPDLNDSFVLIGLIAAMMAFNFIFLLGADKILKVIGPAALKVVSVVVGLLLAALAFQLMIWGFTDLGVLDELTTVG